MKCVGGVTKVVEKATVFRVDGWEPYVTVVVNLIRVSGEGL